VRFLAQFKFIYGTCLFACHAQVLARHFCAHRESRHTHTENTQVKSVSRRCVVCGVWWFGGCAKRWGSVCQSPSSDLPIFIIAAYPGCLATSNCQPGEFKLLSGSDVDS